MHKKRLVGALILAVGITAGLPLSSASAGRPNVSPDDDRARPCANISVEALWGDGYDLFAEPPGPQYAPRVDGTLDTAAASCVGAKYTLRVMDAAGNDLVDPIVKVGDGVTKTFTYQVDVPGSGGHVCVLFTSAISGRVVDSAPNAPETGSCAEGGAVAYNGGSGAGRWF